MTMARVMHEPQGEALDALRTYLEAVGREPLLTAEEEIELAQAIERCHEAWGRLQQSRPPSAERRRALQADIRQGKHARERFIAANLRLVVSIAKRYQNQGLPLLDLIQEGNVGLMRATQKFDYKRGFRFSTYATWWIRRSISRAIAEHSRSIHIPVHV